MATRDGGKTWTRKYLGPTMGDIDFLNNIHFSNPSDGWVMRSLGGYFLTTTDGGHMWTRRPEPATGYVLNDVWFINPQYGFAVGYSPPLQYTRDGGKTWRNVNLGIAAHLYGIAFANGHDGWAVGAGGVIMTTTDGGQTWVRQPSGTTAILREVVVHGS